jgi:UDP-glucuronate 4-epimerase
MTTIDVPTTSECFLVTGAFGCIGAWTVRALVQQGASVVAYDIGTDPHRLRLIMTPAELDRVIYVNGDITDLGSLERALDEHSVTNIVHLAALQVPFCRADPILGASVNVVGTVAVFEAAKRRRSRIRGVAYASSIAVYGPADEGAEDVYTAAATFYGVHKQANEGTARIYWQDEGYPSIGVRPYVIYGPGRDQGMTSGPTLAMAAAARGEGFNIAFGGRTQFQYAADVARAFLAASRAVSQGAEAFNLPSSPTHVSEIVDAIVAAAPEVAGRITYDEASELPFAVDLEATGFERVIGHVEFTPLDDGVRQTIDVFRRASNGS